MQPNLDRVLQLKNSKFKEIMKRILQNINSLDEFFDLNWLFIYPTGSLYSFK